MLLFFLSIASSILNLDDFVDGLGNLEYHFDENSQKTHFYVTEENLFLFFQNIPYNNIKIQKNGRDIRRIDNPHQLQKYSIVKVSINWSMYNSNGNYLIGFVNSQGCDYLFYTNSPKYTFPPQIFSNIKKCFYNFKKN